MSASQVRRFALRKGDYVKGFTRPPASNEKYPALLRVDEISGMTPDEARDRARVRGPHPAVPRLEARHSSSRTTRRTSPAGSST